MGIFDDGLIFNHKKKQAFYYCRGENRLPEIESVLEEPIDTEKLVCSKPKVNTKKENFEKAVEKAKEYVTAGDIFQVVLSKRFQLQIKGSLVPFYQSLRTINPSPYMYFYKSGDHQIVGSSPEMLVRVENRMVETFPIAGTKPISENPVENRQISPRTAFRSKRKSRTRNACRFSSKRHWENLQVWKRSGA